jgi:hypothetical protein
MIARFAGKALLTTMLAGLALLPASASASHPAHATRTPAPKLQFVTVPGYTVAIRGTGWRPDRRVAVSLAEWYPVVGLELRTTNAGGFVVGVKSIDLCNGDLFAASDFAGHEAHLAGPGRGCPINPLAPIPTLTVVTGKSLVAVVHHVDVPPYKHSVVMRVAQALYLREAGTSRPGFIPSAPAPFFFLLARGRTPPRACPEVECASGFLWEWVGMKTGKTGIGMNPACRPQCEIASFLIPVTIQPRKPEKRLR